LKLIADGQMISNLVKGKPMSNILQQRTAVEKRFLVALALVLFASGNALAQRTAPTSVSVGAPGAGYGQVGSSYSGDGQSTGAGTWRYNQQSGCANCGVVESIREIKHEGDGSALATLGGAAVGGTIGRQLGDGKGRVAATIAGAVLGAAAGNQAAKKSHASTSYQTTLRMDDGSVQTLNHSDAPKWRTGQEVQLNNGTLSPR